MFSFMSIEVTTRDLKKLLCAHQDAIAVVVYCSRSWCLSRIGVDSGGAAASTVAVAIAVAVATATPISPGVRAAVPGCIHSGGTTPRVALHNSNFKDLVQRSWCS